jgi:TonB-dependent receptor
MSTFTTLRNSLLISSILSIGLSTQAFAQDEPIETEPDEIVATGEIQRTFEQSLEVKKNTTAISDALIGGEIGDLPDLSIAESLERITGVTSDRFKGGASELSIRGLGAFLGSSTMNGREITTGSDGRDVNFGQFPSELVNGAQVFKSQQANFIEGGISGIIELQTLRPLDYNKKRLQLRGQLGYSEYEDRVDDGEPFAKRLTGSYVDQFETGAGDIGIAIGGQIRRDTAAEDIYTSSSTYNPCTTIEGEERTDGNTNTNNCRYRNGNTTGEIAGPSPLYFASNQYILRAMQTQADRDSIMANVQWQPNPAWDINLDAQWSNRDDLELRHNLVIADGRRDIVPLSISPTGALEAWTGETRIENQSVWRNRVEEYLGLGANVEWSGDRLTVAADVGYSKTTRDQDELDMRIRTSDRVTFMADARNATIPSFTLDDVSDVEEDTGLTFDLNNHDIYDNGARARRRLETNDEDVLAFRLDADYELSSGFFTNLKTGVRFADRKRINDDGIDTTISDLNGYDSAEVIAARRDSFPVEDLFEGVEAGAGLGDNTWATWRPEELFVALTGSRDAGLPDGSTLDTNDSDVDEVTYAIYAMADFAGEAVGLPIYGNLGIRAVQTEIDSLGVRNSFNTVIDPMTMETMFVANDDATGGVESNSFTNILPSANLIFEVQEDMLLRFAAYRAIARPDVRDMSAALDVNDGDEFTEFEDAVSASGNPFLEPLESTNFDISYEWYKSDDTAFSAAVYYKTLQTGRENQLQTISLVLDGTPTDVLISRPVNSDEDSSLFGLELSVNHKFNSLPGFLSGFGFQAGYNYAASDFNFPDPALARGIPVAPLTEPANIPGYSEHTGNITGYWENDDITIRVAYKGRTPYFKPFRTSQNRFTNSQEFIDFSASYDVTDNLQVRFSALNLTDEPNLFFRPTRDSLAQADYSGRRFFAGLRARF